MVPYPGQPQRKECIQASGGKVKGSIFHRWLICWEKFEHEKSSDADGYGADDEDGTFFIAIREPTNQDGKSTGNNLWQS